MNKKCKCSISGVSNCIKESFDELKKLPVIDDTNKHAKGKVSPTLRREEPELNLHPSPRPKEVDRNPYFNPPEGSFQKELENLINAHGIEGGSDTPDFILAEFLRMSLDAFDITLRKREEWYERAEEIEEPEEEPEKETELTLSKVKEELKKVTDIQTARGNWDYDHYMHGMANGLILASAIAEGTEPEYLNAPKKWIRHMGDYKNGTV